MGKKKKEKDFIIVEYPGTEDLNELIAISVVEHINMKAGREIARLKPKVEKVVKPVAKIDTNKPLGVQLRR